LTKQGVLNLIKCINQQELLIMALGSNLTKQQNQVIDKQKEEPVENIGDEQVALVEEESKNEKDNLNLQQYCVFKIGREEYAIPIHIVKEVVKYRKPAPLPQMPTYILGATNIRGNVFGILDIQRFFNIQSDQKHNYLLVLDHEEYKMSIGIPEVPDSMIVAEKEIENLNSSTLKSQAGQKYLKGVIKKDNRMIILFDVNGIISNEKFTDVS